MTITTMEASARREWTTPLLRATGVAAMLGSVLFVLAVILHSLEPVGCIADECATRSMRSATPMVAALLIAAVPLILVGIAGLLVMARRYGRHIKLANAGTVTAAVGFAILFLSVLVQALFFDGDLPWMPFLVIPGSIGVIVGFLMIAIFILRSGLIPLWLGIFFAVSSVLLLASNEQTASVLFAIPFGLAIGAVGFFMWTNGKRMLPIAPGPA
ncbi:hypothetical protein [Agromyces binzhouensis]|uniref:hypothetical protein n=1 Tax=Agromyces binzhouensis TaxID=1817495 RepID=UPI0036378656